MFAVGETLQGRYRIVREIGAGGMGTVYEGENLLIRRRVAIKVMREDVVDKPDLCARFELEAQIASQIPSDHITEVLDLGELEGGRRFIVMEYLVGESLAARLERVRRVPPRELLGLVRQVLLALGAAHRAGVIHRDVKPDNVFLLSEKGGRRDFVKLLDFGISKLRPTADAVPLTQSGVFMGTPTYMAPEQMGGTLPSPLCDLYAVGVMLYRGLTGEMPFQSQRVHDLVYQVAVGSFVRPSQRAVDLDPALDALVCTAMARFPEQRFQSAEQFVAALDAWLAGGGESGLSSRVERSPPTAPSSTTARLATPFLESVATAPGPTPASTELSVIGKRSPGNWLGWAAAGGLLLVVAAGLLALWRSRLEVADRAGQIETQALEPVAAPASAAAAVAAAPAPLPAVAPAAPAVAPVAATAPTPTVAVVSGAQPGSAAPLARPSGPVATHPQRVLAKPAQHATTPRDPGPERSSHAADPGNKPRPDWGY
jgi:serine/threonine protein kinase